MCLYLFSMTNSCNAIRQKGETMENNRYKELLEARIDFLIKEKGLSEEEARREAMPYMNTLICMGVC